MGKLIAMKKSARTEATNMINQNDEKSLKQIQLTSIWLSSDTYRKLLQVEGVLLTEQNSNINPTFTIKQLIEFWNKHHAHVYPVLVAK